MQESSELTCETSVRQEKNVFSFYETFQDTLGILETPFWFLYPQVFDMVVAFNYYKPTGCEVVAWSQKNLIAPEVKHSINQSANSSRQLLSYFSCSVKPLSTSSKVLSRQLHIWCLRRNDTPHVWNSDFTALFPFFPTLHYRGNDDHMISNNIPYLIFMRPILSERLISPFHYTKRQVHNFMQQIEAALSVSAAYSNEFTVQSV